MTKSSAIDYDKKQIYVDFSTLAKFQSCKELTRLESVEGWRKPSLSQKFGHAIHAGWQGYYDALAGGFHDEDGRWWLFADDSDEPERAARVAFLKDLHINGSDIPAEVESHERRSIERGLGLLEAYIWRWRNEPYENLLRPTGEPYTEVGFKYFLSRFEGYDVIYVGYIDRLMRSRATDRPTIFEGKTTTQALSQYIKQAKPNHQVTGYFKAAQQLFPETRECVWDCMFISDRQPNDKKALTDRFWQWGIDCDNDFKRQSTQRSATDIAEFLVDAENTALEYCKWLTSGTRRWPRTAPGACHSYGGCLFRDRCSVNLLTAEAEESFMSSFFVQERWEPWNRILERAIEVG